MKIISKSQDQKSVWKEFYSHGIGHMLGLDVHDNITSLNVWKMKFQKGMVLTIEPGIYLRKPYKKIKPCGVRIENTVLVQDKGVEILTDKIPLQENLLGNPQTLF